MFGVAKFVSLLAWLYCFHLGLRPKLCFDSWLGLLPWPWPPWPRACVNCFDSCVGQDMAIPQTIFFENSVGAGWYIGAFWFWGIPKGHETHCAFPLRTHSKSTRRPTIQMVLLLARFWWLRYWCDDDDVHAKGGICCSQLRCTTTITIRQAVENSFSVLRWHGGVLLGT